MNNKVYNFQFPSWCNEVAIFGYRFSRIEEYKDRLLQLQHRSGIHSEFQILVNTGGHKITSKLEYPSKELKAVFEWEDNNATALHDILVLISIFTGREVFVVERELASGEGYIPRDPRVYNWGALFGLL